jgi:hypothetical protein
LRFLEDLGRTARLHPSAERVRMGTSIQGRRAMYIGLGALLLIIIIIILVA